MTAIVLHSWRVRDVYHTVYLPVKGLCIIDTVMYLQIEIPGLQNLPNININMTEQEEQ